MNLSSLFVFSYFFVRLYVYLIDSRISKVSSRSLVVCIAGGVYYRVFVFQKTGDFLFQLLVQEIMTTNQRADSYPCSVLLKGFYSFSMTSR